MVAILNQWQTPMYAQLYAPLAEVVGDRTAKEFTRLKVRTVGDLLRHIPRRYLSGTDLTDLETLTVGDYVAVIAKVGRIQRYEPRQGRAGRPAGPGRLEVSLTDGQGRLSVTFFGKSHLLAWWETQLGKGVAGLFVGKVGVFRDQLQMSHPEFVMLDSEGQIVGQSNEDKERMAELTRDGLVGLYPASAKLPTWTVAECARLAADSVASLADPWPDWLLSEAGQPGLAEAFAAVHQPRTLAAAERGAERLRFDEAMAAQLAMAYRRHDAATHTATPRPVRTDGLLAAFDQQLPFELTTGQREVSAAITADLDRTRPMQRLLQGEVGSGKTVVALRAMLTVVDSGGQAALLAPTEVLAAQHYQTIVGLLGELAQGGLLAGGPGTEVALLTGSMSTAARRAALLRAASGEAGIVIGTHALLADKVQFADLGLVVVDEQHRFGVEQRAALAQKAKTRPHLLVLTATPIPRSVAMTIFGDLEVSALTEIPSGRQPVSTVVVDTVAQPEWVRRAWQRAREEVAAGRQVFVVAPRINTDPAHGPGVIDLAEQLAGGALAGLRVATLHGQLSAEQKDRVMADFAAGRSDVLVATTVIEVGIDVPNATMMVICEAERFGISQLHQLRGRIGRGAFPGVCLLLTGVPEGDPARERLAAVARSRDGFELAELDLEQRKEGDVLGSTQSGSRSSLRLLRVLEHAELIGRARELAEWCVSRDPNCTTPGFRDAIASIERLAETDLIDQG